MPEIDWFFLCEELVDGRETWARPPVTRRAASPTTHRAIDPKPP